MLKEVRDFTICETDEDSWVDSVNWSYINPNHIVSIRAMWSGDSCYRIIPDLDYLSRNFSLSKRLINTDNGVNYISLYKITFVNGEEMYCSKDDVEELKKIKEEERN